MMVLRPIFAAFLGAGVGEAEAMFGRPPFMCVPHELLVDGDRLADEMDFTVGPRDTDQLHPGGALVAWT